MAIRRTGTGESMLQDADWAPVERRRALRLDAIIKANVRSVEPEAPLTKARAIDISEHGLKLLTRRRLHEGGRVEVDLECELPLRVHLGFAADSLVIDGPMHTHLVRVEATVVRVIRLRSKRMWEIGLEFCPDSEPEGRQLVQLYVDHLRGADMFFY